MTKEEPLKLILDSSASYILTTSSDDRLLYISPLLRDLLRIPDVDVQGKPLNEMGLPESIVDLLVVNLNIVKQNRNGTSFKVGPENLGGQKIYECHITPVLDEEKGVELFNFIFNDITAKEEFRRTSYFIDQMLERLQKSNDINDIIPLVLKDIASAFDANIVTLLFRQDEHWYPKYAWGVNETPKDSIYLEEQPSLVRLFKKHNNVYILNDQDRDGYFVKRMADSWGVHLIVAVPLHIQGEVFAFLMLAYRYQISEFSRYNINNIKKIGSVLSLAFGEDRYIWSREDEITPSRKYLDQMSIGAALLDARDGNIIWANATYHSVIPKKYQGSEVIRMPYYHISSDFQGALPEDVYRTIVTSGREVSYGCIQERNANGVLRYWQVSFLPLTNEKGFPMILNLLVDVTEWENANKKNARLIYAIQEEQYRVRTLLDSVPVGVYISDAEGHILEISKMGQKIWGDRPLPRNIEEYGEYKGTLSDTGEELKVDDWPIAKAVRKGVTTIGEVIDYVSFDNKPGTIINSAAPIRNRHGTVIGAVEIDQDITELKALERNLEATKAYLEATINQMPAGVAIAEAGTGRITYCNDELRKSMPFNAEVPTRIDEYCNFGLLDGESGKPLAAHEHPLAKALMENRTINNFQTKIRKRNGEIITVLSSASPIRGKNGKVEGAVTVLIDITHQKEIEERLEKQTRDLAKFNSDMQRFAYVTSNELRESLKSITNYLNLIDKNSS